MRLSGLLAKSTQSQIEIGLGRRSWPADCHEILDAYARVLATFGRLGTGTRRIPYSSAISMLSALLTFLEVVVVSTLNSG